MSEFEQYRQMLEDFDKLPKSDIEFDKLSFIAKNRKKIDELNDMDDLILNQIRDYMGERMKRVIPEEFPDESEEWAAPYIDKRCRWFQLYKNGWENFAHFEILFRAEKLNDIQIPPRKMIVELHTTENKSNTDELKRMNISDKTGIDVSYDSENGFKNAVEKAVAQMVEMIKKHEREVDSAVKAARSNDGGANNLPSSNTGTEVAVEEDSLFMDALALAVESGRITTSLLQRRLSLGYGRAAKLIDRMQKLGYVSAQVDQNPRDVLITAEQLAELKRRDN